MDVSYLIIIKRKKQRYAHNFCIHQCTVGEQIKSIGELLSNKEQV